MTGLGSKLLDAAKRDYQGQLAKIFANLEILCNHPVGIGEHADVVGEVQKCIESIHVLFQYMQNSQILDVLFQYIEISEIPDVLINTKYVS